MKSFSTLVNAILAAILVWLIASQPHIKLQAPNSAMAAPAIQAAPVPQIDSDLACNTGRTLQVSGTAVVNVIPDRALVQLGIESNGITAHRVEAANSDTIHKITRALKKLGIEEKDIVTDWYVIYPVYDSYSSLVIKGYRIDNVVAVTLRDITQVNQVIIAALDAGANQVINVEFYLSDLRKYRDQARQLAVKAAREKAEDLAYAAGAEIGCVLNLSENTWSNYFGGWYGQSRDLWTQNVVQNAAQSGDQSGPMGEDGPVNLGQISVRAEVNASFSIK
jgi:hypothetical protein